jgi:hypothetical protein
MAFLAFTYIKIKMSAWNIYRLITALLSCICHSHNQLGWLKCWNCTDMKISILLYFFIANGFEFCFSFLWCYIYSFCLIIVWWIYLRRLNFIFYIWIIRFIFVRHILYWRSVFQSAFKNLLILYVCVRKFVLIYPFFLFLFIIFFIWWTL